MIEIFEDFSFTSKYCFLNFRSGLLFTYDQCLLSTISGKERATMLLLFIKNSRI